MIDEGGSSYTQACDSKTCAIRGLGSVGRAKEAYGVSIEVIALCQLYAGQGSQLHHLSLQISDTA